MDTVLAGVVAVVGTVVGAWSSYLFQRRGAERAEAVSRQERIRQEQLTAYSAYAGAVTELKRAVITLWFRRRRTPRDGDLAAAQVECDRLGAAAEAAAFRLRLVVGGGDGVGKGGGAPLSPLMDAVSARLGELGEAEDRQALRAVEARFEAAVGAFLEAAARRLE
ncbi:hypothetical protein ABZ128_25100 [Streptomyces sp. NPDC006326]|uniref:hypothetical protein n=1 Tax=Streptomyces sp. NPDC006326 TaxID=3156752 RepID=UPI0033A82454